ncbi:MAG TPA: DUF4394 domain-containing protein [Chitinophagales bacterium]|nr:DUF4394 domain-containing protein [Chitinophagales bacterium]
MKKASYFTAMSVASLMLFASCQKDEILTTDASNTMRSGMAGGNKATTFYALSDGLQLDRFNTQNPGSPLATATISGLQPGETILAIDFRPATGQLYGLGSSSRLYVINPMTGVARPIGVEPFMPALSGTVVGFDFNPTVDRIRIVTSTGQNLRVNPETGAVAAVDGVINGQAGAMISAVAYTNNTAGSTSTVLYDIDPATDQLFIQIPPNAGTLSAIGNLGLDVEGEGGFDISPNNDAFAIYMVNGVSTLFSVDLQTGGAVVLATYPMESYTALAVQTETVAYALDASNNLLILSQAGNSTNFNSGNTVSLAVTGLGAGVTLVGLDMRPLNGQLYALGSNGSIYTINASSGAATLAGMLSTPLVGTSFGFDFNPLVDRIRIVSDAGQNLRFNPNDGTTIVDGNINPGTPAITAVAYTNSFAGTTSTTLLAIDPTTKKLYQINPPNAGTLVAVGDLNPNISAAPGFDIGGTSGIAYAVLQVGSAYKLYTVDTSTGQTSPAGSFGNNEITAFTIGLGF